MARLSILPFAPRVQAGAARIIRLHWRFRLLAVIATAVLFGLALALVLFLCLSPDPLLDGLNVSAYGRTLCLWCAVGAFLLTGLALSALAWSMLAPILQLAHNAVDIAGGDLDHFRPLDGGDELGTLAAALDQMRRQLKHARGEKERHRRELGMLNEIMLATSPLLDPQQILDLTLQLVIQNLGVQAGAVYLLDQASGRLSLHACRGMPECRAMACDLWRLNHIVTGLMQPDSKVVSVPITANNCYGTWQDSEGRSFVGIPLRAKGAVTGAMTLVTHPQQRLTEDGARTLQAMGDAIGLALSNALYSQNAGNRATVAERQRLAREMHDSLAQALACLKLKAALTDELLSSGEIARAQDNLRQVKEIVRETYLDVREQIFGLRQPAPAVFQFLPALQEFFADYGASYRIDVQLAVLSPTPPEFSQAVCLQLTRIIQEALTNVRKHAHTSQARVSFEQIDHHWDVTIEDGGSGFDLQRVQSSGGNSLGLHIMRERAGAIGASLELDSHPGGGTRVIVHIPLAE